MESWQTHGNTPQELVLSSRIRIARNIKDTAFPHKLDEKTAREVVNKVEEAFYNSSYMKENYSTVYLWEKDDLTANSYLERHIISPALLNKKNGSAFIVDKKDTVSIMINEEDHLRFQCISAGFNLADPYEVANKLDDMLEETLEYAFDENIGYITACPTNIGTGLRASVMLHLPALTMNNEMTGILKALTQVGMTIRGLYGEGTQAQGNIYQISNQVTLGISEKDIISNIQMVVQQIINQENATRGQLYENYRYEMEDKVFRSLGILKNAVVLNSSECMELLSSVRMGIEMGIIKDVEMGILNSLLIRTQPASLQKELNTKLTEKERDINRAKLVKNALKNV